MRNKERDIEYCGVSKSKIENSNPVLNRENFKLFKSYILERYKIHILKDILKKPKEEWTSDEILKNYRFTNVRREHDTESKWVINNVCNSKKFSLDEKIKNIILFRMFNLHTTMESLGAPFKFSDSEFNPDKIIKIAKNSDLKFNRAYMTSGLIGVCRRYINTEEKAHVLVLKTFMSIVQNYKFDENTVAGYKSAKDFTKSLTKITGIGVFLAYQIFIDCTYIEEFPFSENEFTVAGVGCKRGLNYLFENKDEMTDEECIFWLRNKLNSLTVWSRKFKNIAIDLSPEDRCMNVMSVENCLCEIDKYLKKVYNVRSPKRKYP